MVPFEFQYSSVYILIPYAIRQIVDTKHIEVKVIQVRGYTLSPENHILVHFTGSEHLTECK